MSKTITQTVVFKNTTPEALYRIYMDSKKHSDATGGKAKITSKEGTPYSAWDGYITGKNLKLLKNKMIVQSWRSSEFKKDYADSVLILLFEKKGKDALIHMVHANVQENHYKNLQTGWNEFYWKPLKAYLAGKKK